MINLRCFQVAKNKEVINLSDAYKDTRFSGDIDKITGTVRNEVMTNRKHSAQIY